MGLKKLLDKYNLDHNSKIYHLNIKNGKKIYIIKKNEVFYEISDENMKETTFSPKTVTTPAKKTKTTKIIKKGTQKRKTKKKSKK